MSSLLSLKEDMSIMLKNIIDKDYSIFVCQDVIEYENSYNYRSNRYILRSIDNNQQFILDVQKRYNQDIQIICYDNIEMMEYDLNFFSLLGTSPLGYRHKEMKNIDFILYKLINSAMSDTQTIKYIVSPDELPSEPTKKGYLKDGNGNWYFLSRRESGNMLKFEDDYKLSWEYEQDDNFRLLIEIKALTNIASYIKYRPTFFIYSGKELKRADIKLGVNIDEYESII